MGFLQFAGTMLLGGFTMGLGCTVVVVGYQILCSLFEI